MEQTTDTQLEIDRVLSRLSQKGANQSTKPALMVNIIEAMRGLNNGYPKHMYHAEHEARVALNEAQESMLLGAGYRAQYIHKYYPKRLLRRNLSGKFAPVADPVFAEKNPSPESFRGNEWVEEREVRNAAAEKILLAAKVPHGCSPWVEKLEELPDLDQPNEDQSLAIARLEGQLDELRRKATAESAPAETREERRRGATTKGTEAAS